jgi:HAD superfamily 5'-nucleotidase-like hydrolase
VRAGDGPGLFVLCIGSLGVRVPDFEPSQSYTFARQVDIMKQALSPKMQGMARMIESHISSRLYAPALTTVLKQYQSKIESGTFAESKLNPHIVYANNYMNFGDLKVVGFDLDYTLVPYTVELQHLIYNLARDVLVNGYGYPFELSTIKFDPTFAIRGLTVDARHGVISKLSHLQRLAVNRTYRGKHQLTPTELEELYGDRHVPHGDLGQMRPLNDLFSTAEGCLIADAMEVFMNRFKTKGESFAASAIVEDVKTAISSVHTDGSMQSAVLADPDRYIKKSPSLGTLLTHVKDSGKQLFLCTNSGFNYSNQAMNHALGLKPDSSEWRDLFDVVICNAKKPDFYKSRQPFREFDTVRRSPTTTPINTLKKGQVYVQGSAAALRRATGWSGHDVLYLGDNLYADLVEARRWHGWHTGAIIGELEAEVATQRTPQCKALHFLRSTLRSLIFDLQTVMQHPDAQTPPQTADNVDRANPPESTALATTCPGKHYAPQEEALLRTLENELHAINSQLSQIYNPHFGSVFRTDGHPSLFAFSMLRYVDLYMADVCDLVHYNPLHRFYPYHSMHMAHDPASLTASNSTGSAIG